MKLWPKQLRLISSTLTLMRELRTRESPVFILTHNDRVTKAFMDADKKFLNTSIATLKVHS